MKIINILGLFSNKNNQIIDENIEKTPEFTRYLAGKKGAMRRKGMSGAQRNEIGDLAESNPDSLKFENY